MLSVHALITEYCAFASWRLLPFASWRLLPFAFYRYLHLWDSRIKTFRVVNIGCGLSHLGGLESTGGNLVSGA